MLGSSWVAAQLAASQEGLSSMKLVIFFSNSVLCLMEFRQVTQHWCIPFIISERYEYRRINNLYLRRIRFDYLPEHGLYLLRFISVVSLSLLDSVHDSTLMQAMITSFHILSYSSHHLIPLQVRQKPLRCRIRRLDTATREDPELA
jgi:hypothetical protein